MMITIIFPAYNEEKRINKTLKAYIDFFKEKRYEFIVVDDGSKDKTAKLVSELAKKDKRIRLIKFNKNKGKGEAIFAGFKMAKGDIIGFTDADLAYKIEDVSNMILKLQQSNDMDGIIASRYLCNKLKEIPEPFHKKLLGRLLNFIVKKFLGLNYADTQAGAKIFKRKAIKEILRKELIGKRFSFDIDILYRLKKGNLKVEEYPTTINETCEGTTFRLSNGFLILRDVFKIKMSGLNNAKNLK